MQPFGDEVQKLRARHRMTGMRTKISCQYENGSVPIAISTPFSDVTSEVVAQTEARATAPPRCDVAPLVNQVVPSHRLLGRHVRRVPISWSFSSQTAIACASGLTGSVAFFGRFITAAANL